MILITKTSCNDNNQEDTYLITVNCLRLGEFKHKRDPDADACGLAQALRAAADAVELKSSTFSEDVIEMLRIEES